MSGILMTGGSGKLGRELHGLLPEIAAPPRAELDITRPETVAAALERYQPQIVVHAAAYTDVAGAERERELCWRTNVDGTRHIVRALLGTDVTLVYLSTDYVFEGTRGRYREDETPGPVRNYYALTKLIAESIVRLLPRHLSIRSSFRPRVWPYPMAFTDVYTSQDYIDVIAPDIALAIARCREIPFDTLHIATERKTSFELARRRNPEVRAASKAEAPVLLPDDISLDVSRWEKMKEEWSKNQET
ncbi:MAG: SDR family oxidoreductase [Armatimonadota bacterium]